MVGMERRKISGRGTEASCMKTLQTYIRKLQGSQIVRLKISDSSVVSMQYDCNL
jgi:hypothetical protein